MPPRGLLRAALPPSAAVGSPDGEVLLPTASTRLVLVTEMPGSPGPEAEDDGSAPPLIMHRVLVTVETADHVTTKWRTVSGVFSLCF